MTGGGHAPPAPHARHTSAAGATWHARACTQRYRFLRLVQHSCLLLPQGEQSFAIQMAEKSGGVVSKAHPEPRPCPRGTPPPPPPNKDGKRGKKTRPNQGQTTLNICSGGGEQKTNKKTAHASWKYQHGSIKQMASSHPICGTAHSNQVPAETEQMPAAGPFPFFLALWEDILMWDCGGARVFLRTLTCPHPPALVEGLT